ncbi:MAG: hypothetical protein ACKVQU_35750, partial [Burkholderiales bacterium]
MATAINNWMMSPESTTPVWPRVQPPPLLPLAVFVDPPATTPPPPADGGLLVPPPPGSGIFVPGPPPDGGELGLPPIGLKPATIFHPG